MSRDAVACVYVLNSLLQGENRSDTELQDRHFLCV